MHPIRLRAACAVFGAAACGAGCAMPAEPPGELVGQYAIEGALTRNECGDEALPAADPLSFDVELRREAGTGYWLQGMPPATTGQLSDDGSFRFEIEQAYTVDPDARPSSDPFTAMDPEKLADPSYYDELGEMAQNGPCRLRIVETVEGTVRRTARPLAENAEGEAADEDGPSSDGSELADLVADNSIRISAEAGSSCGLVMREQGGPFDALPCTAHYDLVGTMRR